MAKHRTVFACSECGHESARWLGRCPDCGEYNTLVEQQPAFRPQSGAGGIALGASQVVSMADPSHEITVRLSTGIGEFDRVLGGGLVAGSAVLLAGDPGIGKSTLLLQAAVNIAAQGIDVLYVSAEESIHQVQSRARRLGQIPSSLLVTAETEVGAIEAHLQEVEPALAIVDSVQAVSDAGLDAAPGTISQVRQCAGRLIRLAKQRNLPLFLVGHVTKEGVIAGPRLLEHMVDTVLYLEGERHLGYRLLRGQKNRFGSTDEVGIFEMTEAGLAEVADPSGFFLSQYRPGDAGTALSVVIEGSRPILVEVQGLVTSAAGQPRRACAGIDYNRLYLILAVLEKQIRIPLATCDVFVNVPGGLRVTEPAVDLAVALSLISSYRDTPLPAGTVAVGEIGLSGEVRFVSRLEHRLAEAARLGLSRALAPAAGGSMREFPAGMEVLSLETLREAVARALLVQPKTE